MCLWDEHHSHHVSANQHDSDSTDQTVCCKRLRVFTHFTSRSFTSCQSHFAITRAQHTRDFIRQQEWFYTYDSSRKWARILHNSSLTPTTLLTSPWSINSSLIQVSETKATAKPLPPSQRTWQGLCCSAQAKAASTAFPFCR